MGSLEVKEVIRAHGHLNISAVHPTTLEVTKETCLTRRGDCVIAVGADKAISDLSIGFLKSLQRDDARLTIMVEASGLKETLKAFGSSRLILSHCTDIVVRKSSYVCNRTLAINAEKAAADISRRLAEKLKDPCQDIKITLAIRA